MVETDGEGSYDESSIVCCCDAEACDDAAKYVHERGPWKQLHDL